ncbi:50S ribosomal protein L25 [Betaproteobacteria bacterium]|nr:50S ribosomal protein L25 [Betaproteobacteria bacterium]GHT95011.1 50S ribosomal protein L25 [Betaproteobacteria bacterium]GHU02026.1 50S ribosomal protein L25 [Betaproteobacteria bacterium]GHU13255.1 50S ribosomal protein L25 [Betaproteobacteria bacterium]GHU20519.1 50S ribosomal protein L25 [Betaproteobacteria bacterium]
MAINFKATRRELQGTSASRRLRLKGQLPGIIYGGGKDAQPVLFDHNELFHLLKKEAFHSSLLTIDLDGNKETAVLRDTQWHPYRQQVLHIDFLRVDPRQALHIKVPLHFINGEISPAVKLEGSLISHVMTEIDIKCLPADLPEYITVNLEKLETGHAFHVSHLVLPKGVEIVHHGEGDPVVASAQQSRGEISAESEAAAAAPAA